MGHVDTEMVMRIYGKWIPDKSKKMGYKTVNNWDGYIEQINPLASHKIDGDSKNADKSITYMVEAAAI